MNKPTIVVIGASSGGIEALRTLFLKLNSGLNAVFLVVLHFPQDAKSSLPQILSRKTAIPVDHAQDYEIIQSNHIYIAPPGRHLILEDNHLRLIFSPRINHTRPAIDPLFESAANIFGPRVVGIILSGMLYDGSKGLFNIHKAGGLTIVQAPEEATFPDMPINAMQYGHVDYSLPVEEIAALINRTLNPATLEKGEDPVLPPDPDLSEDEPGQIQHDFDAFVKGEASSQSSILTCPDCGGVLWEFQDGEVIRYRCHTGHIFNAENLLSIQDNNLESAFWTAIRLLIEKAAVARRLATRARKKGQDQLASSYDEQSELTSKQANILHDFLIQEKIGAYQTPHEDSPTQKNAPSSASKPG